MGKRGSPFFSGTSNIAKRREVHHTGATKKRMGTESSIGGARHAGTKEEMT
ncbi:MAG: hypothetical protein ABIK07_20925 [Planctomycetota bacterium]